MRPPQAALPDDPFPAAWHRQLLADIVAGDVAERASRPVRRRRLLAAGAALTAAAVALVVALVPGSGGPAPAFAAVRFAAGPRGAIVAMATNPFVAADRLNAVFKARHLDITVSLLPASPSLVGTAVYIGDDGGADGIQPLQRGHCAPGGWCPIGVIIRAGFHGQGAIALGRPARPGEHYASSGDVSAPGEAMSGLRYRGARVTAVLGWLRLRHITVPEYRVTIGNETRSLPPSRVPGNWVVSGAAPWAPGQVLLFVGDQARRSA